MCVYMCRCELFFFFVLRFVLFFFCFFFSRFLSEFKFYNDSSSSLFCVSGFAHFSSSLMVVGLCVTNSVYISLSLYLSLSLSLSPFSVVVCVYLCSSAHSNTNTCFDERKCARNTPTSRSLCFSLCSALSPLLSPHR